MGDPCQTGAMGCLPWAGTGGWGGRVPARLWGGKCPLPVPVQTLALLALPGGMAVCGPRLELCPWNGVPQGGPPRAAFTWLPWAAPPDPFDP